MPSPGAVGSFQQGTGVPPENPHQPHLAMFAATLFTGLDLHKRSVVATTLNAEGTTGAHRKLPAHPSALALYFADLPAEPGVRRTSPPLKSTAR